MRNAIIAIIALHVSAAYSDGRSVTEQKVLDLTAKAIVSDLSLANGEDAAGVINKLDEIATRKTDHIGTAWIGYSSAEIVLLRLGYEPAMQRCIIQWRKYDENAWWETAKLLEWSKQPAVIPYLAEDFFLEEDPKKGIVKSNGEEAAGTPPRSIFSAILVGRIIKQAPDFSVEMKGWADRIYEVWFSDAGEYRAEMRRWWIENKKSFESKNYKSVKPPSRLADEPESKPLQSEMPDKSTAAGADLPKPFPIEHATKVAGKHSAWLRWELCIGISLLGGVIVVLSLRRKR